MKDKEYLLLTFSPPRDGSERGLAVFVLVAVVVAGTSHGAVHWGTSTGEGTN